MDELPKAVFTWKEGEDGLTEIVQGRAPIKDILYELVRQAYNASAMERPLPGQPQDTTDEFLGQFFSVDFTESGNSIVVKDEYRPVVMLTKDKNGDPTIKTGVAPTDGKILYAGPYINKRTRPDIDYRSETLLDMDYADGLPVKTSIVARDGQIFFCSGLYDLNHRVGHTHVLRTANMALEARL